MTVTARHKKPLTEAQIAQRRAAGRVRRPQLSAAELQQRQTASLAARDHSTGPTSEEGKTASSRNAWKHGQYSAAHKRAFQLVGGSMRASFGKPCVSTCRFHPDNADRTEAPCSLVLNGLTKTGGDCLDKTVYVEAFDALITAMKSGDMDGMNGIIAANLSGHLDLLQRAREEIATNGFTVSIPLVTKEGALVRDADGKTVPGKIIPNPAVFAYIRMFESAGMNLGDALATPLSRSKLQGAEEERSTMATLVGAVMSKFPGVAPRIPRTIEHGDE